MPGPTPTPRTRRSAVQVGATWDPDQRWFYPAAAGAFTYALGWIPVLGQYQVPVLGNVVICAMPALGLAVWLGSAAAARHVYPTPEFGERYQERMVWLARCVAAAVSGWWMLAGVLTPTNPTAVAVLIVLVLGLGIWWALLLRIAPQARIETQNDTQARQELHVNQQIVTDWTEILRRRVWPVFRSSRSTTPTTGTRWG